MRITKLHKVHRGCKVVRVYQVLRRLEGRSEQFEGYLPRPPTAMLRPNSQYSIGNPRSLEEVEDWVDRNLKSGKLRDITGTSL